MNGFGHKNASHAQRLCGDRGLGAGRLADRQPGRAAAACSSRSAASRVRRSAGFSFASSTIRNARPSLSVPRDVVLSTQAWNDLQRINQWVNTHVRPMTDMDHWGVVERWNYPDDGYGDCEDYALAKRKMLIQAGWPREALLDDRRAR